MRDVHRILGLAALCLALAAPADAGAQEIVDLIVGRDAGLSAAERADIYALGCVAYYLLTGQLVFEASTPMRMFLEHLQARPIPPSQRTELPVPRDLDDLIMACLEKDPAKRPQDAQQLFKMVCECGTPASWSTQHAQAWWETHLPDLTGPLTIDVQDPSPKGVPVG